MATILLVEDEVDLCNLIRGHLEGEGHTVLQAFDGQTALTLVDQHNPQLLILDWMLPGLDGLTVCRRVRQSHLMPILMLTARSKEIDRVLGLEVGADDYVVKPFSIRELVARVRAVLRRVALDSQAQPSTGAAPGEPETPATLPAPPPLVCGALRIDPVTHMVTLGEAPLEVTPKEYDLL